MTRSILVTLKRPTKRGSVPRVSVKMSCGFVMSTPWDEGPPPAREPGKWNNQRDNDREGRPAAT